MAPMSWPAGAAGMAIVLISWPACGSTAAPLAVDGVAIAPMAGLAAGLAVVGFAAAVLGRAFFLTASFVAGGFLANWAALVWFEMSMTYPVYVYFLCSVFVTQLNAPSG